jgi:phosphoribosyl 1,2-cyclic phosphodiesterase
MRLIVIGSSSSGCGYALDAGGEILLLEAGMKYKDMAKAIGFRIDEVVGCLVTHHHQDHAKYAEEYSKHGITINGTKELMEKKHFQFGSHQELEPEKTEHIGGFDVVPFHNHHDCEIYGYLIRHKDMGTLLFSTDTYKIGLYLSGIDHYLIEANYCDDMLKNNVWDGKINKAQADRIMLSHMSLQYTVKYLQECHAENSKTITLCHLSDRNSDPTVFQRTVAGAFGVPCYVAQKNLVVELNKDVI